MQLADWTVSVPVPEELVLVSGFMLGVSDIVAAFTVMLGDLHDEANVAVAVGVAVVMGVTVTVGVVVAARRGAATVEVAVAVGIAVVVAVA